MSEPRYGIWIPVYGNWRATNDPQEPRDASYARAKALLQLAEQSGFTTTLIAQHLINPRNQDFSSWKPGRQRMCFSLNSNQRTTERC